MADLIDILDTKKQIVLFGPPGTGKTRQAQLLAQELTGISSKEKKEGFKNKMALVQFHPSYSYEDFVRGISVFVKDEKPVYEVQNRTLAQMAKKAQNKPEEKFVLIIDEINRANLPAVLGELIYALEYRGKSVQSMYALGNDDREIVLPENLYIIGTMNTADRSVGHIDYAIRRRFAFVEMPPKQLNPIELDEGDTFQTDMFIEIKNLFIIEDGTASDHLSMEFRERPLDVCLGHSYFIDKKDVDFKVRMQYEIAPILEEYVKDGILKNDDEVVKKIIQKYKMAKNS